MAENSRIEWTDHTFNPWWGCVRVSPACKNCYAEAFAKRIGQDVWGPKAPRRFLSDQQWSQPLRWDANARKEGVRARVFCASMADVFEDRSELDPHRQRLWGLIEQTPNLDWLLLTKRPENISGMVPWSKGWPDNVWLGVTVEDQKRADQRLPILTTFPAAVRFISAEPVFSELDLSRWRHDIDWVIAGGESGVRARASDPAWFYSLRDKCAEWGIAFHFKQWGEWAPYEGPGSVGRVDTFYKKKMQRVGKKQAGRNLDGRTWDGLPEPRSS